MQNVLESLIEDVQRFNEEIIGLDIPEKPTRQCINRKLWAIGALQEELDEFQEASTMEDEADALVDLSYFALGRLVEMGLCPPILFNEVQRANMGKVRGELSKRPHSMGYDAIKPRNWIPPNLTPYLTATKGQLKRGIWRPKILVLGYARHGKDTACEFLAKMGGLKFISSSQFCAKHIVSDPPGVKYASSYKKFQDRMNHRKHWFDEISRYVEQDKSRLSRDILAENDIYCGMRSLEEFEASKHLFDLILWIDRSHHQPVESKDSCSVSSDNAGFIVSNNYSLVELQKQLSEILRNCWGTKMMNMSNT